MASRAPRPKQAPKLVPASKQPRNLSPEDIAWVKSMVIYEDAEIMGFNKPSGLSSQGGRGNGHNLDDMMWGFAKSNGKRPKLVHRLDRDTSGILLVAKTQPAVSFLGKAMIRRAFDKTYLAIVSGADLPDRFTVDAALRREEVGREAWSRVCPADHPDAQTAQTAFEVLKRSDDAVLLSCRPHTGRMHQIRVHLAHLGAPIAGDVRYGGALSLGGQGVKRLMLHALSLTFPHPSGGEMTLSAPVPADFNELRSLAGL
ncbi:ribosomal large subunit pseudouridine synthase D [Asticcacaulis sp. AC402]|nr:ribosomal large subunit pseudouridine synthase D [Asticcacaulis sp. AC402]